MCPRTVSRNLKSLNSHIGTFRTVSEGVCRILKVCPRQGVSLKFWSSTFTSEEEVTGQESEPRGIYPGHLSQTPHATVPPTVRLTLRRISQVC